MTDRLRADDAAARPSTDGPAADPAPTGAPRAVSSARATATGAAYTYGAQVGTVVLQFGYAALTSRLLGPSAFGEYSAGLISAGLVTQIAIAGIPQAVTRLSDRRGGELTSLLLYAAGVGLVSSLALLLTAPLWAALWGTDGAADIVRLLALNILFVPLVSFATGMALRARRFKMLATVVLVCNVTGMAAGGAAVLLTRAPESLVVSVITAQALTAVVLLALLRRDLTERPSIRTALANISYSFGISSAWSVYYIAANLGRLAVSRALGHSMLGYWNRAEVLTTVPFYQVQNAMAQALYPQFRKDREDPTRARRIWADLLGLVAWLCLPAAAMLAVGAPVLVQTLFGPGWAGVEGIAPFLALIGGVQALAFVLVAALEVLGRIAWLWQGYLLALVVAAGGAAIGAATHELTPTLVGLLVAVTAMHGYHVVRCAIAGLIGLRPLLGLYASAAVAAAIAAAVIRVAELASSAAGAPDGAPLAVVVAGLLLLGAAVALRHRLPVVRIARKHGIL